MTKARTTNKLICTARSEFNTVAAIAIACFKALIVVLYFMHVKYSTRLIKLTVIAGLYWLGIIFALTLGDYLTRAWGTFGQQITLQ